MGGYWSSSAPVSEEEMAEVKKGIEDLVSQNKVVIYSKKYCPYCTNAIKVLDKLNLNEKYVLIELSNHPQMDIVQDTLMQMTGARSVPRVFVNGTCIGGGTETVNMFKDGTLQKMVE